MPNREGPLEARSLCGLEEGPGSLAGSGGLGLGLEGRPCKMRQEGGRGAPSGLQGHRLAFAPHGSLAPDCS